MSLKSRLCFGIAGLFFSGALHTALAESKPNPYQSITERNPFGLRPPPPPPDPVPTTPVVPPCKVILTGITSLFGPSPRALLEITEQEPGKPATVRKPILREGEKDGPIEVLSIDFEKSLVTIRNAGNETNITFESPKLTTSAPAGPGAPAAPAAHASASAPTVITSASAAANASKRGTGVTIVGAGGGASVSGGSGASYGATGGTFPVGSGVPVSPGYQPATSYNNPQLANIPSRPLRADAVPPPEAAAPVDPAKQYLRMAVEHEVYTSAGIPYPPLPPMPGDVGRSHR